jgi:hypothetical protein
VHLRWRKISEDELTADDGWGREREEQEHPRTPRPSGVLEMA